MTRLPLLAVAACLVVVGCTSPHPKKVAGSPSPSVAVITGAGDSPTNESQARADARAVLDLVKPPPGAREVTEAPDPKLTTAPSIPQSPFLVDESRIWVAPGQIDAVMDYIAGHPSPGLKYNGGKGSMSGRLPSDRELMRDFDPVGPNASGATVQIAVVSHGASEVGIRADVQIIWSPPKPSEEYIPATDTNARVRIDDGIPGHKVIDRAVSAEVARQLGKLINALRRDTRGTHGCLADMGYHWQITFPGGPELIVVDSLPACLSVTMTVGGKQLPGLFGGGDLDTAIRAAVGLKPRF